MTTTDEEWRMPSSEHDHDKTAPCTPACPARVTGAPPSASERAFGPVGRTAPQLTEEARLSSMASELEGWWRDKTLAEVEGVVPKAIEYSSSDLVDIGRQLASFGGVQLDDAQCAELGIAFYLVGKLGRVLGALKEGRPPSDDTWHDIAVYTKMAQRVRDVGSWPGV